MREFLVIAVDGPSASGKGTLARKLAEDLNLDHLDTGLLYRAVAIRAIKGGIAATDTRLCTWIASNLQPDDLLRPELRDEATGGFASVIASDPALRSALYHYQRDFAQTLPAGRLGVVIDGRDIGTVICPDADLKIFLTADLDVRAARRFRRQTSPVQMSLSDIRASLETRDRREASRHHAPMRPADDAVIIDSTFLTMDEVVDVAISKLKISRNSDNVFCENSHDYLPLR